MVSARGRDGRADRFGTRRSRRAGTATPEAPAREIPAALQPWVGWALWGMRDLDSPLSLALVVVGWLFFLKWRGSDSFQRLPAVGHNLLQLSLIFLTMVVLGVFIAIVAEGLLGSPEMFIRGNGSSRTLLRWYEARCDATLPQPQCFSVSIWWYRLLMLLWALWLAAALIRWLLWGWQQFSADACFRRLNPATPTTSPPPPPLPTTDG